jgi:enamine deaminase RidA (YjgF/YER057c/UK114 family)
MNNSISSTPQSSVNVHIADAGKGQLFVTAAPTGSVAQPASNAYGEIVTVLRERSAEIIHERIFGSLSFEREIMDARKRALVKQGIPSEGPVTYIEGAPSDGPGFAGAIIHAIVSHNPSDVWTIFDHDVPCGRGWRRNGATFLALQNIQDRRAVSRRLSPPALQAKVMIERAERILREQGVTYRDVVRTWFYLSDILSWYSEFNDVRNSKYSEFGIVPDSGSGRFFLPASTGVGGINPQKGAAVMDLLAVTGPRDRKPVVKQLTNNRQLDAFRYGSAFSRGVLIRESDVTTIQISGTAAIDDAGKSLYPGDARSQIEYTLDQVEALLGQEGAGLKDIAAATVFVKRAGDASLFREIIAARGIERFPAVCVVADICRDELLFEMDAEAAFAN